MLVVAGEDADVVDGRGLTRDPMFAAGPSRPTELFDELELEEPAFAGGACGLKAELEALPYEIPQARAPRWCRELKVLTRYGRVPEAADRCR